MLASSPLVDGCLKAIYSRIGVSTAERIVEEDRCECLSLGFELRKPDLGLFSPTSSPCYPCSACSRFVSTTWLDELVSRRRERLARFGQWGFLPCLDDHRL